MLIKNFKLISSMVLATSMLAANAMAGGVHMWQSVYTTEGTWNAKLTMINEDGFFVDRSGAEISSFSISPSAPVDYGFGFYDNADFDIAYSLTLTQNDDKPHFSSKACVYIVTASGPAKPDVRTMAFNDATCEWNQVRGKGLDFMVY